MPPEDIWAVNVYYVYFYIQKQTPGMPGPASAKPTPCLEPRPVMAGLTHVRGAAVLTAEGPPLTLRENRRRSPAERWPPRAWRRRAYTTTTLRIRSLFLSPAR